MEEHEHNLQIACVRWFRLQYPKHLIYAIPNGGRRNVAVAAKLKAEGVLPGVPDLHIPVAKGGFHGLYGNCGTKDTVARSVIHSTIS